MSDRTRRTSKKDWAEAFLDAFRSTGMVSSAARIAGIGRRTAYDRRENDEEFAAAWDEIVDETTDEMEREAFRRAVEGTDKPIVYQGVICDTVKDYSDTLLIFLLKARKPEKYRERHEIKHTGDPTAPLEVNVTMDAESREKLADVLRTRPASGS